MNAARTSRCAYTGVDCDASTLVLLFYLARVTLLIASSAINFFLAASEIFHVHPDSLDPLTLNPRKLNHLSFLGPFKELQANRSSPDVFPGLGPGRPHFSFEHS